MVSALSWSLLTEVCILDPHVGPAPHVVTYTLLGELIAAENVTTNGESDLDLEYAMNLVTSRQNITLYQVGDLVIGMNSDRIHTHIV